MPSSKNSLLESLPDHRKKAAARIPGISGGAYHHVVFLDAMDRKAKKEDFVIKIPGHGTSDRWRPEDEYMLLREADIMQYLWRNTTIPVPEAGNPDVKFTTKSVIYQAAIASIYEGGSIYDFTAKLLAFVPLPLDAVNTI
jgi:hypothetical protein